MLLQKYENLLQTLNSQITNGVFNIEENKDKLEKIIEIYKELKAKNYDKAKSLINELGLYEENIDESLIYPDAIEEEKEEAKILGCPAPSPVSFGAPLKKSNSQVRDWNIETIDEDNIEAFNSIEMMSAIFLQNIKNQIGTQK